MSKNSGLCIKCKATKRLERHHLFPKVHYGQSVRVLLCHYCHRSLEAVIQTTEGMRNGQRIKRDKQFYVDITLNFLMSDTPEVSLPRFIRE